MSLASRVAGGLLLSSSRQVPGQPEHECGGPHWESTDGSKVLGTVKERADAPVADAIPWLLLAAKSVGSAGAFSKVTSIQRVNTAGGAAPRVGCSQAAAGALARIDYTADYYFFTAK